jgi:hypothetical protein
MFRDSAFQYPLSVCPLWAGQKSRSRRENRRTIFNRPRVAHLGAFGGSGFRISFEATGGPCDLGGRAFLAVAQHLILERPATPLAPEMDSSFLAARPRCLESRPQNGSADR